MSAIEWKLQDSIGILTINSPPENYLEEPEFAELSQLKQWTGTNTIKGIIINGKGRHFSAGANLKNLYKWSEDPNELKERLEKGKIVLEYIENLNIPVIAAIKGTCFGGGLEIALSCHIRVCGKNTLLAFPEVNHNLMPGLGATIRLPRLTETHNTVQFLLTGDLINAETALELRLVDYVVPSKDVIDFALKLMKKMVNNRPLKVIHSVMRSIRNANKMPFESAMIEETKMFCELAILEARNRIKDKTE